MRVLWRTVALAVVGLMVVMVTNALRHTPLPVASSALARDPAVDAQRVAEHLAEAIRLPTISHQEAAQDDRTQFAKLRALLEQNYPLVHAKLERELINGDALLYHWRGSDEAAAPVLFLAHQDVVPVEPGTEQSWTHPAFAGAIAEGYVWGRGALDDKASLIGLFEAFESLLREGYQPRRSLWLASGFDEEVGGRQGAKFIVAELARRKLRFAWLLDEGGGVTHGIVPDVQRPVATIAVAEKGYLSLELVAHAEGGHSSMPPKVTAVGLLAAAITRLEHERLSPRLTPIAQQGLELIAAEMPWPKRLLLSNLWLTRPLVVAAMDARAESSPTVRTSFAPTMLHAGIKDNVLPSSATAVLNFRLLPGDSSSSVTDHVRRVVGDSRITVKQLDRSLSEAAPLSSTTAAGYHTLEKVIHAVFPDALIMPTIMNGASDARHFVSVTNATYRFAPYSLSKRDLKRIHGTNERIGVEDLTRAVQAYRLLVREAGTGELKR